MLRKCLLILRSNIFSLIFFPEGTIFNVILRNTHNKKLRKCSMQQLRLAELYPLLSVAAYTIHTVCAQAKSKSNKTDFIR